MQSAQSNGKKRAGLLDWIERAGNRLPHPFWLFCGLCVLVVILSDVAARYGALVPQRDSPELVPVRSLISAEGLSWFVLHMVENFAHFEPLGLVLVMLMGVAIAEGSGLIAVSMRAVALAVPDTLVVPVLFAAAACGNIGSDAGVVVVPPLAAVVFRQLGRNPVAGLLVGYVGATAGFTANVFPAGTDVIAASLTNAASHGVAPVNVLSNWYFMVVSVPFLAVLGTVVTRRFIEPRLPSPAQTETTARAAGLSDVERRALRVALLATLLVAVLWSLTIVPSFGPLRSPEPDQFWRSPFFRGLIPILFTLFAVAGIAYGVVAQTVRKADDVLGFMSEAMKRMGPYIVLVLVIAQFIAAFQWSRLDVLLASSGAAALSALGFSQAPLPFFVAFIVVVAIANLFIGSASAKWAIFAPIFVPIMLELGVHPGFTQLLYRVGDSITNCVSPLYPYFPLLLGWIAAEEPESAQVGTVLSFLIPYAVVLFVGWVLMLIGWYLLGLPLGPATPIMI